MSHGLPAAHLGLPAPQAFEAPSNSSTIGRGSLDDRLPVRSEVATVTTIDDTTLYSFSVPRGSGVAAGAFFRVLDSDNTKFIQRHPSGSGNYSRWHGAARLVGALFDQENPINPNDPVRELAIGGLLSGEDTERKVRKELKTENRQDAREQREFDNPSRRLSK